MITTLLSELHSIDVVDDDDDNESDQILHIGNLRKI